MTINERVSDETLNEIIQLSTEFLASDLATGGQGDLQPWLNEVWPEVTLKLARELQQYRAAAKKPIFFVDIEGDDWIAAGRMGDWPDGVDDANAGRWPGCAFDFDDLPDGRVPLYAVPQLTSAELIYQVQYKYSQSWCPDGAHYCSEDNSNDW